MKIGSLIVLILVSMTSCTITKQRYSKGFHVEWKKRSTTNYSTTSAPLIKAKDAVFLTDSVTKTVTAHPENDLRSNTRIEQQEDTQTLVLASQSHTKSWKRPAPTMLVKDKTSLKKTIPQQHQSKNTMRSSNFWEAVSDFLFWALIVLLLITIAPLLHTLLISFLTGFNWKSTLFIVLEWVLWLGGIIGILLLVSGGWPIVLACIGWNLLFAIFFTAMAIAFDF